LQQFAKAGDVGEYLKNLLSKKNEISVEDEEAVSKINNAIKRAIKAFDDFEEHTGLNANVNATMLKNLLDKVTALLAAIPVREE
jgi:anaerobic ribonucleoside-triphosphate reductase